MASWLVLVFVSLVPDAFAQNNKNIRGHESSRGAWRLYTDPHSRSTTVKFYNAERQLVYQEVIGGKYIKLTKKNVRLLDQALNQLVGNQLIASSVKSTDLVAYHRTSLQEISDDRLRDELIERKAVLLKAGLRVNTHANVGGKLRVIFENPDQQAVTIRISDQNGLAVYEERTFITRYLRDLNLNGLKADLYLLEVKGKTLHFTRQIAIDYPNGTLSLKIISKDKVDSAGEPQLHSTMQIAQ
jgi:hypothetical protein